MVGTLKEADEPESIRNDVDQDVFLMFTVVNENLSWYLEENIQNCSDSNGINRDEDTFVESNLMHGKNKLALFRLPPKFRFLAHPD